MNLISATNLFPDEPPDTDRCNITETAHFSDIDEDDPSPLDGNIIPQIDDHEIPTNTTEFHQESSDPSLPHDDDDEPPLMDNDVLVQTHDDDDEAVDTAATPSPKKKAQEATLG